ncbi:D-mannonate dehydratase [Leeuwenhoekiella marinoflava DSM 3653]|uniref:Mannonate dehydratase n=2 Tax=Leeuwenhoekiella marinoflava TaxID=988 RepID=A0A4Q0PP78_9FLAO|nr:D-mannonate dehydratase [Leeuwenhoekiella marinoflava]SHE73524.1 D-mannonate dehydratase [Leeuwenhoekiella marinoflava DSM 3653]
MKTSIIKTMRWYGDRDLLSLDDLFQAGITGIVTALHHIPVGAVWTPQEIQKTKAKIEAAGMSWEVVESLPVHEHIKKRTGNYAELIENYKTSLQNLADQGIFTITYNFMPILDWVRTDHRFKNARGAEILKYDPVKFRMFDLFILKRPGASGDYTASQIKEAQVQFERTTEDLLTLKKSILLGLPGSTEDFTEQDLLKQLAEYDKIDDSKLREHLVLFLKEIAPVAEEIGILLAIHPDDPPFSVLGLPRIVSTAADLNAIFSAIETTSCGLCYCTGSLGANPENDLIAIFEKHKDRIHFLHLRNVQKFEDGSFFESDHLEGDVPMKRVMQHILEYTAASGKKIPMRPDHGYLHALERDKAYYAGYSFIGRLKGLAELTGLELGLQKP